MDYGHFCVFPYRCSTTYIKTNISVVVSFFTGSELQLNDNVFETHYTLTFQNGSLENQEEWMGDASTYSMMLSSLELPSKICIPAAVREGSWPALLGILNMSKLEDLHLFFKRGESTETVEME